MLIKEDFQRLVRDNISDYPAAALLYQVGDPQLLAALDAICSVMATVSQQIEVAMEEPFIKVRDATVLADATLKGILPMARTARVRLNVTNPNLAPYTLQAGRRVLDSNGRAYVVETPVVVAAGGTGQATALQSTIREIEHVVTSSQPFYTIEIPPSPDDSFIAGIMVTRFSDDVTFTYAPQFCNVSPGDTVYNVETDEYRRLFVRFGFADVVGTQPLAGERFDLAITECNGDVRAEQDSPFTLEYTLSPADTQITLAMDTLLLAGAQPVNMATLRELTRYPSVYDDNAVFLGEFDFLIRRRIPALRFLSVWNEQIEERVRSASLNNINILFVSVLAGSSGQQAAIQAEITEIVRRADDSLRLRFVPTVDRPIAVQVEAFVSIVNDPAVVAQQIRQSLIREYGERTPAARRGQVSTRYNRIGDRLRTEVPALRGQVSDLKVVITDDSLPALPEERRFISEGSATITVTPVRQNLGNWGS